MAHAHDVSGANTETRQSALVDLDRALHGIRQLATKPPIMSAPIPQLGRRVEFAKLLGCSAVSALSATGEPVTVKAVAAAMDLEQSTASRLLSDAEGEGFITRSPHPLDKRSTVVHLTSEGEQVVRGFTQARLGFLGGLTSTWPDADIDLLATLLQRFMASVNEQKDCWAEWVADAPSDSPSTPDALDT